MAVDDDFPTLNELELIDAADERTFARTAWPTDNDDLPLL